MTFTFFLMLSLISSGCENELIDLDFPVSFQFNLINSNDEVAETFLQGEDVKFTFEISNTSDEIINLSNFQPELLCKESSEFFRLHYESIEANNWVDLGRPCIPMNCPYEGTYEIGAKSIRKIEYFWVKDCDKNSNLEPGKCKTEFDFEFEINGGRYNGMKSKQSFSISFIVQ